MKYRLTAVLVALILCAGCSAATQPAGPDQTAAIAPGTEAPVQNGEEGETPPTAAPTSAPTSASDASSSTGATNAPATNAPATTAPATTAPIPTLTIPDGGITLPEDVF